MTISKRIQNHIENGLYIERGNSIVRLHEIETAYGLQYAVITDHSIEQYADLPSLTVAARLIADLRTWRLVSHA